MRGGGFGAQIRYPQERHANTLARANTYLFQKSQVGIKWLKVNCLLVIALQA